MSNGGVSIDALMPKDMAVKAENIGIAKAGLEHIEVCFGLFWPALLSPWGELCHHVWSGLGKIVVSSGSETVFTTGLLTASSAFGRHCCSPRA